MAIGTYDYTYGVGGKNRQIQFFRTRTGSIEARIFVLINAATGATAAEPFTIVPANQITYQRFSRLEMAQPVKLFSKINRAIQLAIIRSLTDGNITVFNGPNFFKDHETITYIHIDK